MNPRLGVAILGLVLPSSVSAVRASRADPVAASATRVNGPATDLVGAWRLGRLQSVRPSGELALGWRGRNPSGLLVYLATGHMAVQIVRDPPAAMRAADPQRAPPAEKAEAFDGYYAGDTLVLSGMNSFELEGETRHSRLVWIRERRCCSARRT